MTKLEFMRLWDIYGGLLTPTQREMTDMYFNLDLTVSEIAEQKGVSRQAVSECLAGCKKQLESYENTVHFLKILKGRSLSFLKKVENALSWADDFFTLHPEYAADIAVLKQILNCDNDQEI